MDKVGPFLNTFLISLPGGKFAPQKILAILAIFLHSIQQELDQGTLGTQRLTLIGSWTHPGPSINPAMALQYTQHGLVWSVNCIFLCMNTFTTKM